MIISKDGIVSTVSNQTGIGVFETEKIVDAFVSEIMKEVAKGNMVCIKNFGTFKTVRRAERIGRNLNTMESVRIPARIEPKFKPSDNFKNITHKEVG